jgi:hypothetical protein
MGVESINEIPVPCPIQHVLRKIDIGNVALSTMKILADTLGIGLKDLLTLF